MDIGDELEQRRNIWVLIEHLFGLSEYVRRSIDEHPLDPVDIRVLALADERGGLRPSDAATELEIASPSVTRHVRKMQSNGLIAVVPDPIDGRSYLINCTTEGRTFLHRFQDDLIDRMSEVLADWPEQRIATLAQLISELGDAVNSARQSRRSRQSKNWWRE